MDLDDKALAFLVWLAPLLVFFGLLYAVCSDPTGDAELRPLNWTWRWCPCGKCKAKRVPRKNVASPERWTKQRGAMRWLSEDTYF